MAERLRKEKDEASIEKELPAPQVGGFLSDVHHFPMEACTYSTVQELYSALDDFRESSPIHRLNVSHDLAVMSMNIVLVNGGTESIKDLRSIVNSNHTLTAHTNPHTVSTATQILFDNAELEPVDPSSRMMFYTLLIDLNEIENNIELFATVESSTHKPFLVSGRLKVVKTPGVNMTNTPPTYKNGEW